MKNIEISSTPQELAGPEEPMGFEELAAPFAGKEPTEPSAHLEVRALEDEEPLVQELGVMECLPDFLDSNLMVP